MVKHLTKVGYADYGRFLFDEPYWVWLSGRGMRLSGTGFAFLRPKIGAMARMRAVNEVRFHIAHRAPDARWICGHSVVREQGLRGHRPNAVVEIGRERHAIVVKRRAHLPEREREVLEAARFARYDPFITSPLGVWPRAYFVTGERESVPRIAFMTPNATQGGAPMAYRTRVFIDFWNFQLNWNDRASDAKIDWPAVPRTLLDEAKKRLEVAGIEEGLVLDETLVYASYNPAREGNLKRWLDTFLDKQPGFRVKTRERREKTRRIHCSSCGEQNEVCAKCDEPFRWAPEKGIDTAVVTDLLSLASEEAFDVAILLSSDADHIPAVEWVQGRGLKVINATWARHGFDLAKTCWAAIELDAVIPSMTR